MNQKQKRYAEERVRTEFSRRCQALKEKHTKPAKELTEQQKLKAIRSGDAPLKVGVCLESTLRDAFMFDRVKTLPQLNTDAYDKDVQKEVQIRNQILDELILGDSKAALEKIKKYCQ